MCVGLWGDVVSAVLFLKAAVSTVQPDLYHAPKPNPEQTNQHAGLRDLRLQWNSGVRDVHFWGKATDSLDVTLCSSPYRAFNEGISRVHRNEASPKKTD